MRRKIAIVLALTMALSIGACNGAGGQNTAPAATVEAATEEAEPAAVKEEAVADTSETESDISEAEAGPMSGAEPNAAAPDTSAAAPDENAAAPDANEAAPDANAATPDANAAAPDANAAAPDANEATPDTNAAAPDANAATPDANAAATDEEPAETEEASVEAKIPGIANRKPLAGVEISIKDIDPLLIGQAENKEAGTGCTVLICKNGMRAGLDVRGGGPASRESQLLNPLMSAQILHAIVLAGGSAYGLGTANGVMSYLEEQGIGYDTGYALVPLVAQSDIYDLSVGDPTVRPDPDMGYAAAKQAFESPNYQDGNFGAGCGASVGKIAGMKYSMKTGIGSYAVQIGDLKIGAIVVLNALGDVYDWRTGQQIAGFLTEDQKSLRSTMDYLSSLSEVNENKFSGNTTLAVVVTNADFNKTQLCKIAGMAHDGYARSINPVHTSADGDSIYAVSVGNVAADQDLIGSLGAEVVSEAIIRAVYGAEGAYGLPAAADLQ